MLAGLLVHKLNAVSAARPPLERGPAPSTVSRGVPLFRADPPRKSTTSRKPLFGREMTSPTPRPRGPRQQESVDD